MSFSILQLAVAMVSLCFLRDTGFEKPVAYGTRHKDNAVQGKS